MASWTSVYRIPTKQWILVHEKYNQLPVDLFGLTLSIAKGRFYLYSCSYSHQVLRLKTPVIPNYAMSFNLPVRLTISGLPSCFWAVLLATLPLSPGFFQPIFNDMFSCGDTIIFRQGGNYPHPWPIITIKMYPISGSIFRPNTGGHFRGYTISIKPVTLC